MGLDELEFTLECAKAAMLAVCGLFLMICLFSGGVTKLVPRLKPALVVAFLCLWVSALADIFDAKSILGDSFAPSVFQILAEDGLLAVGIGMVALILLNLIPEVQKIEATAKVLQLHEQALVERERREMLLHSNLEDMYRLERADQSIDVARILELTAAALDVSRISIWLRSDSERGLVCMDLYNAEKGEHQCGDVLRESEFPAFFRAVRTQRVLRSINSATDYRTSGLAERYLDENGIKSMCVVRLSVPDIVVGVISAEATISVRNWAHEEVSFLRSVGDLLIQKFARDEIIGSNKELLKARAEFEAIANFTYNWELWLDEAGRSKWTNSAVERITGYSAEEILEMPSLPVALGADAVARRALESIFDSAVGGGMGDGREVRIRHKDGRVYWVSFAWNQVADTSAGIGGTRLSIQDITARKMAEQSFRQSEVERRRADRHLRAFVESTPTAVIQVDRGFNIMRWNASAARIFGWSESEIIGRSSMVLTPPQGRAALRDFLERMFEGDNSQPSEQVNIRKDGTRIICRWYNTVIRDEDGQPATIFSMATDITESIDDRRKVELERQRFKDFSVSASDFFWELDADGRITFLSERLFELTRTEPQALLGQLISEAPGFDSEDSSWSALLEAVGQQAAFRDIVVSAAGYGNAPLRVSLSGVPIFDDEGTFSGFRGCGRDVTKELNQKFVEQAISVNLRGLIGEDYFGALVKNMTEVLGIDWAYIGEVDRRNPDTMNVVAAHGPQGEIVPFTFDIKGKAAQAVLEQGVLIVESNVTEMFPDDDDMRRSDITAYGGLKLTDMAGKAIGVLVFLSSKPVDSVAILQGALNVFGPRAAAELARKRSEQDNEILQRQLLHSQRLETMGALAGGIAHDFNNILTPIMGYAEFLADDFEEGSSARQDAEAILNGARRAKRLVQQILDFSRRKDNSENVVIDVIPTIKGVLAFLKSTMPMNIEIKTEFLTDGMKVNCNSTKFDQVLMNLITNAWHAIGDKPGEILIRVQGIRVDEMDVLLNPSLSPGEAACVSVCDNGTGIDPDIIEKIFEPYFTTKGSGKGTGFGLSTVKGIVEAMGGAVKVNSVFGKGTEFDVILPVANGNQFGFDSEIDNPRSVFAIASRLKSKQLNILFVDDEPENNKVVERMLTKCGHSVRCHDDPLQALAEFERDPFQFDLIITDDSMPKFSGSDLCGKVVTRNPFIPIVVVSGGDASNLMERYSPHGVSTYVGKPFDASDILAAIEKASAQSIARLMEKL